MLANLQSSRAVWFCKNHLHRLGSRPALVAGFGFLGFWVAADSVVTELSHYQCEP
jgi:hypothetical protein